MTQLIKIFISDLHLFVIKLVYNLRSIAILAGIVRAIVYNYPHVKTLKSLNSNLKGDI